MQQRKVRTATGLRGVHRERGAIRARIWDPTTVGYNEETGRCSMGVYRDLGVFLDLKLAARAFDREALVLFGADAILNFNADEHRWEFWSLGDAK